MQKLEDELCHYAQLSSQCETDLQILESKQSNIQTEIFNLEGQILISVVICNSLSSEQPTPIYPGSQYVVGLIKMKVSLFTLFCATFLQ